MRARCTTCSEVIEFRNKRGAKLSNYTCKCGGKFEIMSFANVTEDNLPTGMRLYYGNLLKNKAGEVFYWDREKRKAVPYTIDAKSISPVNTQP